jgi:hypothetical protein
LNGAVGVLEKLAMMTVRRGAAVYAVAEPEGGSERYADALARGVLG